MVFFYVVRNKKVTINYMEYDKMVDFKFTNEEARKEYEDKLFTIQNTANSKDVNQAYLWNETVEKYATKMIKVVIIIGVIDK